MPSASVSLFVAITGAGVGDGSVLMVNMIPSTAKVEMESKRVKITGAKSCCSFFMIFPAKVKLQLQAERTVGRACLY
jgi:hypothetical protein